MKLKQKIEIDFLEFFKTGRFDYLKLGQTKEWIRNNFPDPDCGGFNDNIWCYGNIELHFYKEQLFLIYSDYLSELNGGKSLKLNKWILETPENLTLEFVIYKLNETQIDFTLTHNKKCKNQIEIHLIESGIKLGFIDYNEQNINPNLFSLNFFSLYKQL